MCCVFPSIWICTSTVGLRYYDYDVAIQHKVTWSSNQHRSSEHTQRIVLPGHHKNEPRCHEQELAIFCGRRKKNYERQLSNMRKKQTNVLQTPLQRQPLRPHNLSKGLTWILRGHYRVIDLMSNVRQRSRRPGFNPRSSHTRLKNGTWCHLA